MIASAPVRFRSPWTQTIDLRTEARVAWDWLRRPGLAHRVLPAIREHLGAAPASTAYAFTVFVTWWTLRGVGDSVERRLIFSASTNLYNMRHNPVQVLVASAFWTDGGFPWTTIAGFLIVMAYAERWLGTTRWIILFATGHIGATLLTVTGISHAIDHGVIPRVVAVAADVGTSYGFSAVLAALTYRFRGLVRLLWAGTLILVLVAALWIGPTFTDYGHLCACLIGLAVGGLATVVGRWVEQKTAAKAEAAAALTE
ncbi:rhomboid-like protein [Nocardia sp. NPDC051756]|uniref:rhomboid-like protein n=1 Tax=Nocardia sp. NPDC051756 TaxID=3154751 RepID=UPI00343EFDEE